MATDKFRFINCTGPARWVGSNGDCDGGATEISAGSSAVYNLAVSGLNSFSGSVSFSSSGLPLRATYSIDANPLSVSGSAAVPFTVRIATAARTNAAGMNSNFKGFPWGGPMAVAFTLGTLIMMKCTHGRRRLSLATLLLYAVGLAACGGSKSKTTTSSTQQGTPAGTYTVVLTATSGGISHSKNLTLIVK